MDIKFIIQSGAGYLKNFDEQPLMVSGYMGAKRFNTKKEAETTVEQLSRAGWIAEIVKIRIGKLKTN